MLYSICYSPTIITKNDESDDDDDHNDNSPIPSSNDVLEALAIIRRYVQLNGHEFETQYKYENFVNNLINQRKQQTKITDFMK